MVCSIVFPVEIIIIDSLNLLISSLPGSALRTLVDIARLTCVLKAEPGKLDIKRREPGVLLSISVPLKLWSVRVYSS